MIIGRGIVTARSFSSLHGRRGRVVGRIPYGNHGRIESTGVLMQMRDFVDSVESGTAPEMALNEADIMNPGFDGAGLAKEKEIVYALGGISGKLTMPHQWLRECLGILELTGFHSYRALVDPLELADSSRRMPYGMPYYSTVVGRLRVAEFVNIVGWRMDHMPQARADQLKKLRIGY